MSYESNPDRYNTFIQGIISDETDCAFLLTSCIQSIVNGRDVYAGTEMHDGHVKRGIETLEGIKSSLEHYKNGLDDTREKIISNIIDVTIPEGIILMNKSLNESINVNNE